MKEADEGAELMASLVKPGISKETFFLLYSRLLQVRCGATELEFVADGVLSARGARGKQVTLYLDNLFVLSRGAGAEAEQAIERYLEAFASVTEDVPVERDRILPAVRDDRYVSSVGNPSELACRHLAGDLWIVYVADGEKILRTLRKEQIVALGLAGEELHEIALANLKDTLPAVEVYGEGPSYLLTAGADYVSSLLLIDEIWEQLEGQIEGDVVAVTPSRDVLLFTGSQMSEGLSEIREKALQIAGSGNHSVSATLLRRVAGVWKAFD